MHFPGDEKMKNDKAVEELLNTLFDVELACEQYMGLARENEITKEDYPEIYETLYDLNQKVQCNLKQARTFAVLVGAIDDVLFYTRNGYATPGVVKDKLLDIVRDVRRTILMVVRYRVLDRPLQKGHLP